jgi:hypothetical protein
MLMRKSPGEAISCAKITAFKIASPDQAGDVLAIGNITMSVRGIETLLKLLSDNFVTPVSLPYVVEDWLSN